MKMRTKMTTVLAAALLAALLIMGIAFAAQQSKLLERLFPSGTPSPQAQSLVMPVNMTETIGGVTFTINEYLWDGADLYVNWTARSEIPEPVLFFNAPMTATGAFLTDNGDPDSYSLQEGALLGDAIQGVTLERIITSTNIANVRGTFPDVPFEVTMSALFMRPVAEVVKAEDMTNQTGKPTLMLCDWTGANSVQIISTFHRYGEGDEAATESYNDLLDKYFQEHPISSRHTSPSVLEYQAAYEATGYAHGIAVIEHTFIVEPEPKKIIQTQIDGPSAFSFDDFDIEFTKINFTAASTHINYTLTSKLPESVRVDWENDWVLNELSFDIYADDGTEPLKLKAIREGSEADPTWEGEMWGDPLIEIPQSVTIVPICMQRDQVVYHDWPTGASTYGSISIPDVEENPYEPYTPMSECTMTIPLKQVVG